MVRFVFLDIRSVFEDIKVDKLTVLLSRFVQLATQYLEEKKKTTLISTKKIIAIPIVSNNGNC